MTRNNFLKTITLAIGAVLIAPFVRKKSYAVGIDPYDGGGEDAIAKVVSSNEDVESSLVYKYYKEAEEKWNESKASDLSGIYKLWK